MFKVFFWRLDSMFRGMDYDDYFEWRKQKTLRQLECLPDTPNFLTFIREYYGLKSFKRTLEVFIVNLLICAGIIATNLFVDFYLWPALTTILTFQAAFFCSRSISTN